MNHHLLVIFLAIVQLYRKFIDAKFVVDTNVLVLAWKNLWKILDFDDTRITDVDKPKYAPVADWANTAEGQKFFTDYKADYNSADYNILWNFISINSQKLIDSKLISAANIADLLKIITRATNPDDIIRINGITYAEFFDGLSFKIDRKVPGPRSPLNQIKLKVFESAPGLEIPQSPIFPTVNRNEIPQRIDQFKVATDLQYFWRVTGEPYYYVNNAQESHEKMLKKFYKDITNEDFSTIKDPPRNTNKISSLNQLKDTLEPLVTRFHTKTKLQEFWQKIGNLNYSPAQGSYGEMLKNFYTDVTSGGSSTIKSNTENIINTIASYNRLIPLLSELIELRTKAYIEKNNLRLTPDQITAQTKQLSKILKNNILKNLSVSLNINRETDINTILKDIFSKNHEQTDIGDLLHWLDAAKAGDTLWTHNKKMITELFEYPNILYALSQAGLKLEVQIGDRVVNLDFGSPDKINDSIFKIFEPEFDNILKTIIDELKDSYAALKNLNINVDYKRIEQELAEHLVAFKKNDAANEAIQIIKCAKPLRIFRRDLVEVDQTCKLFEEEISQRKFKEPAVMDGYCNVAPNCIDYVNVEKQAKSAVKENTERNWGNKVNKAALIPLLAQFSQDIAQGDPQKLAKDIAMVAAPTIVENAANKLITPILEKQIFPKMLADLEVVAEKYAAGEATAQASKIAGVLIEKNSFLKVIPGVLGRLTNIACMLSQGNEGQDKISIVVNEGILEIESLQILSVLIVGEEIPGLNIITTALMLEEMIRADINALKAINEKLSLTTLENIQSFFSILFTGRATTKIENDLIAVKVYQHWGLEIKQKSLDDNDYDVLIEPIPDIYVTVKKVYIKFKTYNKSVSEFNTGGENTTYQLIQREAPSSIYMSSFNTSADHISRIFKNDEIKIIAAPKSDDVVEKVVTNIDESCSILGSCGIKVKGYKRILTNNTSTDYINRIFKNDKIKIIEIPKNDDTVGKTGANIDNGCSSLSSCGTKIKDYERILTTQNNYQSTINLLLKCFIAKACNSQEEEIVRSGKSYYSEGFIVISKTNTIPNIPKVLIFGGKAGDKIAISAPGDYTTVLTNESRLQDCELPDNSHSTIILANGRNFTTEESQEAKAKVIIAAACSDISITKKVTVSTACGNVALSPNNPSVIHVAKKDSAILNIKYPQYSKDAVIISFQQELQNLIIAQYDKTNKKLILEFNNNQKVVITKFEHNNNPLLNFDDFNVQLGVPNDNGIINNLHINLEIPEKELNTTKVLNLVRDNAFSNNFKYTLTSKNEKQYVFATNKDNFHSVHTVKDKDNYIIFSNNQTTDNPMNEVVISANSKASIYSDRKVKVDLSGIPNKEQLTPSNGVAEIHYGSNSINIKPLSDNSTIEGSRFIENNTASYIVKGSNLEFSNNINLEAKKTINISADTLTKMNNKISFVQNISKEEVEFVIDDKDILVFIPRFSSTIRFSDAVELITNLNNNSIAPSTQSTVLSEDQEIITFNFEDGKITENDLSNARTLRSAFIETIGETKSVNLNKEVETSVYPTKGNLHLNYDGKCLQTIKVSSHEENEYSVNIEGNTKIVIYETNSTPFAPILSCQDFAVLLPDNVTNASSELNLKVINHFLNNSMDYKVLAQDVLHLLQRNTVSAACKKLLGDEVLASDTYPHTLNNQNFKNTLLYLMAKTYFVGRFSYPDPKTLISILESCIPISDDWWEELISKLEENNDKSIFAKIEEIYPSLEKEINFSSDLEIIIGEVKIINLFQGNNILIYPAGDKLHLNYHDTCLETIRISSGQNEYSIYLEEETRVTLVGNHSTIAAPILSCKDLTILLPNNSTIASSELNLNLIERFLSHLSTDDKLIMLDVSYQLQTANIGNPICEKLIGNHVSYPSTSYPHNNGPNYILFSLLLMVKIYYERLLSGMNKTTLISDLETCISVPSIGWDKLLPELEKYANKPIFTKINEVYAQLTKNLSTATDAIKFNSNSNDARQLDSSNHHNRKIRHLEQENYIHPAARGIINYDIDSPEPEFASLTSSASSSHKGILQSLSRSFVDALSFDQEKNFSIESVQNNPHNALEKFLSSTPPNFITDLNSNTSCVLQLINTYCTASNITGSFTDRPVAKFVTAFFVAGLSTLSASLVTLPFENMGYVQFIPSIKNYKDLIKEYIPIKEGSCKDIISFTFAGAAIAATSYFSSLSVAMSVYSIGNKIKLVLSEDYSNFPSIGVATATVIAGTYTSDVATIIKSTPIIAKGISNIQTISSFYSLLEPAVNFALEKANEFFSDPFGIEEEVDLVG